MENAATKNSPQSRQVEAVALGMARRQSKIRRGIRTSTVSLLDNGLTGRQSKPWEKVAVHLNFDKQYPSYVTLKSLYMIPKQNVIDDHNTNHTLISQEPLLFASWAGRYYSDFRSPTSPHDLQLSNLSPHSCKSTYAILQLSNSTVLITPLPSSRSLLRTRERRLRRSQCIACLAIASDVESEFHRPWHDIDSCHIHPKK